MRGWSTATCWRSFGDGGYDLGARARQIRDDLFQLSKAKPEELLAIHPKFKTWGEQFLAARR